MQDKNKPGRNFDDLAVKFSKKVYGGLKGRIRIAVLKQDLQAFFPKVLQPAGQSSLKILDAGSGHGPLSLELAKLGHDVTLCDISSQMLDKAKQILIEKEIQTPVKFVHGAIQDLKPRDYSKQDLILCHAVLDWSEEPKAILEYLVTLLDTDGLLSLTLYNLNGMIFKNLLRTNYKKIEKKEYKGWPGSLTPTYPRTPLQILELAQSCGLDVVCHSGIRVFHDYILDMDDNQKKPETVIKLELEFSRTMPFRDLGRYQHLLCRRIP